ncbi:MAG TPA: NADH-quinone oxidoreductase subunit N [Polyangiaceae bacterium]
MTLLELQPLTLDLAVGAAALVVLVFDLCFDLKRFAGHLSAVLLTAILVASFYVDTSGTAAFDAYVGGEAALYFKRLVLALAIVGVLGGLQHVGRHTPLRQGEYYFLVLLSVLGMCLLPGARDLILFIVCFELMGMPLYVLSAFAKTDGAPATAGRPAGSASEAGIKFYLVGAASTALMLFGGSLLAGMAGGTSFAAIAAAPTTPLLLVGMLFVLAGMGFKLGVAPFHMWVPDTYQGSSTPFVAFLSAAPKVAGMSAAVLVLATALPAQQRVWAPALLVLCPVTLIVGSLLAMPQTNVKRLLAYSGVAHVGFMLMALAVGTPASVQMLLFYLLAYAFTNLGAFLVVHAVGSHAGDDSASSFDGLAQRSPWLALALLIFMLSLAGIPFVAGFWAKLYVFMIVYQAGHVGLVALAALISVLALFYYLQLVKAAYIHAPPRPDRIRVSKSLGFAIVLCLASVVGIGLWPAPFLNAAGRAAAPLFEPAPLPAVRSARKTPRLASLRSPHAAGPLHPLSR